MSEEKETAAKPAPEDLYPESTKMLKVRPQSEAIGRFLDGGDYVLAEYVPCDRYHEDGRTCWRGEHLEPVQKSIETVLAEHFEIDLKKVETERRAMLDSIRAGNGGL